MPIQTMAWESARSSRGGQCGAGTGLGRPLVDALSTLLPSAQEGGHRPSPGPLSRPRVLVTSKQRGPKLAPAWQPGDLWDRKASGDRAVLGVGVGRTKLSMVLWKNRSCFLPSPGWSGQCCLAAGSTSVSLGHETGPEQVFLNLGEREGWVSGRGPPGPRCHCLVREPAVLAPQLPHLYPARTGGDHEPTHQKADSSASHPGSETTHLSPSSRAVHQRRPQLCPSPARRGNRHGGSGLGARVCWGGRGWGEENSAQGLLWPHSLTAVLESEDKGVVAAPARSEVWSCRMDTRPRGRRGRAVAWVQYLLHMAQVRTHSTSPGQQGQQRG